MIGLIQRNSSGGKLHPINNLPFQNCVSGRVKFENFQSPLGNEIAQISGLYQIELSKFLNPSNDLHENSTNLLDRNGL